jgi:hypothetical protein
MRTSGGHPERALKYWAMVWQGRQELWTKKGRCMYLRTMRIKTSCTGGGMKVAEVGTRGMDMNTLARCLRRKCVITE